ncbi:hypothetical protein LG315_11560 [Microbacterium marinum]|uniref:hypothetical protein n=1 Tax=Microbacterium marinum TaxID=421115 RepID=UPI0038507829
MSEITPAKATPSIRATGRYSSRREAVRQSEHLVYGPTTWARRHRHILGRYLGAFRTSVALELLVVLTHCAWNKLPLAVSDYIDRFVPRAVDAKTWARIGDFVRDSVTIAAPLTPYSANVLIGRAAQYVAWCDRKGWPLDADVIWAVHSIDLFIHDRDTRLNPDTRRNYRGWLLKMARVLLPEENPAESRKLSSSKMMAAPYSAREMVEVRRWATVQRDATKQYRAMLMLVLCAGAGLRPVDIADLRAEHVEALVGGGYIVHVQGQYARDVPLLAEWDDWMEVLLERVPTGFTTLWGPMLNSRHHPALNKFTQNTAGAPPTSIRLRETWVVAHLRAIANLKTLFRAAGVMSFDKLPQFLKYVDDVDAADYVRFLRKEDEA